MNRKKGKNLSKPRKHIMVISSSTPPNKNLVQTEKGSNDSSIIRHGAGQLETFELRESELEKIEKDMWGGRFFDFGINSVTIGVTIIVAILSCDNMKEDIKAYFNFALVLCIFAAIIFFYKSYERNEERKELFKKIRNRS